MKIMVFGRQFPDSLARNIAVTLRDMGHDVQEVDDHLLGMAGFWWQKPAALLMRMFYRLERWHHGTFLKAAKAWQPELIINACANLPPEIVARIKEETDARIVAWFPDVQANLGRQYLFKAPYDALFFKDPYIVSFCRDKLELPAHYLPECCNPRWHRRIPLTEEDRKRYGCDLTTAGNMYYYRALLLEQFRDYDFKIWGASYPRWLESNLAANYPGVFVAEEEKAKAFNAAKIVLNTMHFGEIDGVNCRTFEAAGCGGFQICEWRPELPKYFEPDREIVTYNTKKELKEKVDYYLNRPQERREIADRGMARAHREHTYELRLRQMLSLIQGGPDAPA
jgi:spore maturation protein CgeB